VYFLQSRSMQALCEQQSHHEQIGLTHHDPESHHYAHHSYPYGQVHWLLAHKDLYAPKDVSLSLPPYCVLVVMANA
jgi:hypothetical protein